MGQCFRQLELESEQDRRTDATELITTPHFRAVIKQHENIIADDAASGGAHTAHAVF